MQQPGGSARRITVTIRGVRVSLQGNAGRRIPNERAAIARLLNALRLGLLIIMRAACEIKSRRPSAGCPFASLTTTVSTRLITHPERYFIYGMAASFARFVSPINTRHAMRQTANACATRGTPHARGIPRARARALDIHAIRLNYA
jgi:hypothetical protein